MKNQRIANPVPVDAACLLLDQMYLAIKGCPAMTPPPKTVAELEVFAEKYQIPWQSPEYHRVMFGGNELSTDTENVELSVNGEMLIMRRLHPVILPSRFLECADHAVVQSWRVLPGGRPAPVYTRMFPYLYLGSASAEDYRRQILNGRRQMAQALRKMSREKKLKALSRHARKGR